MLEVLLYQDIRLSVRGEGGGGSGLVLYKLKFVTFLPDISFSGLPDSLVVDGNVGYNCIPETGLQTHSDEVLLD